MTPSSLLLNFLSPTFSFLPLFFPLSIHNISKGAGRVWGFVIESMGQEKRAFILPRHTLLTPSDPPPPNHLSLFSTITLMFLLSSVSLDSTTVTATLPTVPLHCIEILPSYKSFRVQHIISGTIRGRLDRG